jgi:hypothetical protein
MAAENFAIEPAGETRNGAGHLHIMIDTDSRQYGSFIFGVCFGGVVSLGQWLALRGRLRGLASYVPASAITCGIGVSLAFPLVAALNETRTATAARGEALFGPAIAQRLMGFSPRPRLLP